MAGADQQLGALMVLAQRGDAAAYRLLLEGARGWLKRYYRQRVPAPAVEDAVQDALIVIHRKRWTYDGARRFEPWMAAIARYLWIDRLRRMARVAEVAWPEGDIAAERSTAVDDANELERLMASLKPAQAEVIRLTKLKGLSVEETARATGQSPSLVKVNVHRGMKKLSQLVSGMEENDDGERNAQ